MAGFIVSLFKQWMRSTFRHVQTSVWRCATMGLPPRLTSLEREPMRCFYRLISFLAFTSGLKSTSYPNLTQGWSVPLILSSFGDSRFRWKKREGYSIWILTVVAGTNYLESWRPSSRERGHLSRPFSHITWRPPSCVTWEIRLAGILRAP